MHIHYTDNVSEVRPRPPHRRWGGRLLLGLSFVVALLGAVAALVYVLAAPPASFPVGERIIIEEGATVSDVATRLSEAGYVQSRALLYVALVALHDPTAIKASSYRFSEPIDVFELAYRLTEGDFGVDLERFVHYEGERVAQVAARAETELTGFDRVRFLALAEPQEGKLFPDTYLIPETFTAEELVALMRENYESRVGPLRAAIAASDFTEDEVIILASILEREANSRESMRIVSGILQDRLEIGMPLQVDAVFEYILDKPGTELTRADLEVDSPYNTYEQVGLPPTPIGNPGLTAIEAVLEPEASPYLFYLTAPDGTFHYATTYEEHLTNIEAYLR